MDIKSLPTIALGKADIGDETCLARKHPLLEDVSSLTFQTAFDSIHQAVPHLDHQDLVNHIHRSVHPFLRTEKGRQVNKIAKDMMSKGLSVDTVEGAHSVIADLDDDNDRGVLQTAYKIPLEKLPEHRTPDHQIEYSRHEIGALQSAGLTPHNSDIVKSKKTGMFYHYDKANQDLKLIGGKQHLYQRKITLHPENSIQSKIEDHLNQEYQYPSKDHRVRLNRYTSHSQQFNKLHAIHHTNSWDRINHEDYHNAVVSSVNTRSKNLTEAIRNHPKPEGSFHVFTAVSRHSDLDGKTAPKDEHGNILFHAPTFSSTSILPSVAEDFVREKHNTPDGDVHDILKIKIPEGYKHGAYIANISDHKHEAEYLLNKGHTFKVKPEPKFHASFGQLYRQFDAEIVDQDHDGSGNDAPTPPANFIGNNR